MHWLTISTKTIDGRLNVTFEIIVTTAKEPWIRMQIGFRNNKSINDIIFKISIILE